MPTPIDNSTLRSVESNGSTSSTLSALVRAMRPKQWTKNVLVAAVPLASGEFLNWTVLAQTFVAFVTFCLAASGTYLVNDTVDVEADRRHPTKRFRPIAAGDLSKRVAVVAAVVLYALAIGIGFLLNPALGVVVIAYIAVTLSYSLFLKHQPVIELALLSLGFLLRAIAGGAATGIPISSWFLLVSGFGSLFMAAGKRASELDAVADASSGNTRRVLVGYTPAYLRFVWGSAATVTIASYALWAFEVAQTPSSLPWAEISIVPFVLAIFRYAVDIDAGRAGAPDEVVRSDHVLLGLGALWVITFALAAMGV